MLQEKSLYYKTRIKIYGGGRWRSTFRYRTVNLDDSFIVKNMRGVIELKIQNGSKKMQPETTVAELQLLFKQSTEVTGEIHKKCSG